MCRRQFSLLLCTSELERLEGAQVILIGGGGGSDLLPDWSKCIGANLDSVHFNIVTVEFA